MGGLAVSAEFEGLRKAWSQAALVSALRALIDRVRDDVKDGGVLPDFSSNAFVAEVEAELEEQARLNLRRVINGTGIIIHTNLGRAPLAPEALKAINEAARGYANIEYDLETGKRGSRYDSVRDILCELTGAQDAIVVNNCAAAVTISIATFAQGREVIVSRGELVEIGGSFRVPDVISQNGAVLREIGTTNKTHLRDYENAISEETAVLLRTHASNYRMIGFTAKPTLAELSDLAVQRGLILVEDLGSGTLVDLGIGEEPTVAHSIRSGVDLVAFSGDKLLGGPQCGIIVGKAALIAGLRKNPLLRAMRIDKLSLAALEATLRLYCVPNIPFEKIPVLRMLTEAPASLEQRAMTLAEAINTIDRAAAEILPIKSEAGGGSLPGLALNSFGVAISVGALRASDVMVRLRGNEPAIIGRIVDDRAILDIRTLMEDDALDIIAAVTAIAESQ